MPRQLEGLNALATLEDAELRSKALGAMGPVAIFPVVMANSSDSVNISVTLTDPEYGEAVAILTEALESELPEERREAAMSLALIGRHQSSIPAFSKAVSVLQQATTDPDNLTRGFAKLALGGPQDEDTQAAIEAYEERAAQTNRE